MDIVRCEKGHFYDASEHPTCPQCAEEAKGAGVTAPATPVFDSVPPTAPIGENANPAFDSIPPTEPAGGMNSNARGGETTPVDSNFGPSLYLNGNEQSQVQGYGPTVPLWTEGIHGFNPVTGWLVCVDGPDRGTDYRIHNEINYIGRGNHMDICILNDDHISHDKHAKIAYDPETHLFYFGPGIGKNIVRLNGKPVLSDAELHAYDVITIGTTKLCFVPFCGDKFNWSE